MFYRKVTSYLSLFLLLVNYFFPLVPIFVNSVSAEEEVVETVTPTETPSINGNLETVVLENTSAGSIDLQMATVTTNKADYAPTDTVVVTGSDILPNTTYIVVIFSTDDPAVHHEAQVKTDEQGVFAYAYQLDGTYRPNYKVELFLGSTLITSTTFTDTPLGKDFKQCSNNNPTLNSCTWIGSIIQQSNSVYYEGMTVPQRLLLTNIPSTSGNVHTLTLSHQANKATSHAYDFITGYNQGNSPTLVLNECADFGGSLESTCNSLRGGNHLPIDAPDAMGIELGDDVASRAAAFETLFGNRQINIHGNSVISGATLTFDGYTGTDEGYALYTLTWTSPSTDVLIEMAGHLAVSGDGNGVSYGPGKGSSSISGGPYHFKLSQLDGASLGSQDNQIKGADILTPQTGHIIIVKDAVPNHIQDFSFTGSGSIGSFQLDDDGDNANALPKSRDFEVAAGTYSVSETAVSGWQSPETAICSDNSPVTAIEVSAGETVTCTFTNEKLAKITLVKNTVGGDGTFDFVLTGTGLPSTQQLVTSSGTASQTYIDLDPDYTYSITETGPPAGWSLTGSSCTGTGNTPLSITPNAGEEITCTFTNTKLSIDVTKTANPTTLPELGGPVAFTVSVDNTSSVSINLTSLTDSVYGNLHGQGSCSVPQIIAAGGNYTCSFTETVTGDAGSTHTDIATAVASGVSDSDDATVTVTDVLPTVTLDKTADDNEKSEPGGVFNYTLTVTNTSVETVTITALTDDHVLSAECLALIGTTLAPGASTSCTYSVTYTDAGTYPNTAKVTVEDDETNEASGEDSESVTVTDVLPTVEVTKTANLTEVPQSGGNVTYTFVVTNQSVEVVTITALSDDRFGVLVGDLDCQVGTVLPIGGSCEFTLVQWISGSWQTPHINVFTATVIDNDGSSDSDSDDATVKFLGPTRTLGFWQTHTSYTTQIFEQFDPINIGGKSIDTTNKLFAGFYSSISKKSTGAKRSALDQARIQMLQQWLATKLNCQAFGCASGMYTLLDAAAIAWTSGNKTTILSYAAQLDVFNNSGDSVGIGSVAGSATPALSQLSASSQLLFWDNLLF